MGSYLVHTGATRKLHGLPALVSAVTIKLKGCFIAAPYLKIYKMAVSNHSVNCTGLFI